MPAGGSRSTQADADGAAKNAILIVRPVRIAIGAQSASASRTDVIIARDGRIAALCLFFDKLP